MATRTTNKELESLVEYLNKIAGRPTESWAKDSEGKFRANIGNYHISGAYGGVCLHEMVNDSGGVTTPLGMGYFSKRELAQKLRAFISGVQLGKEIK